jgi:Arc/MetJ family transcription regulator
MASDLYILPRVTKRLIDIDDQLLDQARRVFGTQTNKDTVNSALAAAVAGRRQKTQVAFDYFAELSREGALHDRSDVW